MFPESPADNPPQASRRLVVTAGPTHEPIDAVRFLGNRSSGKLGIALAHAAALSQWHTTLLLGPVSAEPDLNPNIRLRRFVTTDELDALLDAHVPACTHLVMAAAVADFKPASPAPPGQKWRRSSDAAVLRLVPTHDLIAKQVARRTSGQIFVGFALEPAAEMLASARAKRARKGVDAIVANPLETLDADHIEPVLVTASSEIRPEPPRLAKHRFADWLLERLVALEAP